MCSSQQGRQPPGQSPGREGNATATGDAQVRLAGLDAVGVAALVRAAIAGLGPADATDATLAAVGRLEPDGLARVVSQAVGGMAGDGAGLIAAGRAVVAGLGADALAPGVVDDEALTASVGDLDRLERMVHGEKLRRISELDARKAHQGKARTTADWLAPTLGLSPGEKAHTDTAAALARLPATARRLREGDLGVGQARQAAAKPG